MHQAESSPKHDAELVKSVDKTVVERVAVMDHVRGLKTQKQQSQPTRQEHGVFPFVDLPEVVDDELENEDEAHVTDEGSEEVPVPHPAAPGGAVGVPHHGDGLHSHTGNQHGHVQLDVDGHRVTVCVLDFCVIYRI